MKAALSARPATDLQAQYIALQQAGSRNTTNVGQASGQTQWLQLVISLELCSDNQLKYLLMT